MTDRRRLLPATRVLALALAVPLAGQPAAHAQPAASPERIAEYEAATAKTILALQPFRTEQDGTAAGTRLRLTSLSPASNAWFLLTVGESDAAVAYHLENPDPRRTRLSLEPAAGLVFADGAATVHCAPWQGSPSELETARRSGLPFARICGGRLSLRNTVTGSRTSLERITDFLRDNVWGGDRIVGFVRDTFYRDAYADLARQEAGGAGRTAPDGPAPARTDPAAAGTALVPGEFGLGLAGAPGGRMAPGAWYAVDGLPGVFASALQPKAIAPEVLAGPGKTSPLDSVEADATDYMVAFDLAQFELGFALGTDHPRLDWSPRPPASVRVAGMPGPDGIDSAEPLARIGMVAPALAPRTVAAFTGGFKREHGAFKYGDLATRNGGSHYGFIEQGVIFSKLQPGLATLYALADGEVGMKTWTREDDRLLPRLRFARQNGVALLEARPVGGSGVPGPLVTSWGAGNWSGSADRQLRTLRAGACLIDAAGRRFLAYGYFSTATPSAMARSFQAYGCRYAMLLDMNALEHTYLALYVPRDGQIHLEHLVPGMAEVDRTARGGGLIPRFIGFPDNRDLFYLFRREAGR